MKKYIICLFVVLTATQYSCKKFLNITPIDKLTGNNFYQSADDIEANITDMYGQLFDKYTKTSFAGATGEFRSGEVIPSVRGGRYILGHIGGHSRVTPDLRGNTDKLTLTTTSPTVSERDGILEAANTVGGYNFYDLTVWNEYYKVIQAANLLVSKIAEGIPALSDEQAKRYDAEARFIRCFCYFQMVRLYGDVVYYTNAFQKDPLPRTNMITVINQCIADLRDYRVNLPVTFNDPSLKGVRASKGAAIGLLMNMNMWNAGFDLSNRAKYWEETASLGKEIMESNAYHLLNLTEWATVVKGRSDESLFELFRTLNYNTNLDDPFQQSYAYAPFGDAFIHFPYKQPEYTHRFNFAVFTEAYLRKLFPDENDDRLDTWFVAPFDQNSETFQLRKFALNTFADAANPNLDLNPDNTYLIMRYSDAILLRAEALAYLEREGEAADVLNVVRQRAHATLYDTKDDKRPNIKDAIFLERSKELLGEGSHYFDLVRTRRIMSRAWTDNPLTADKFNRGAWTWPISPSALFNNPYMTLNLYWIGSGL